MKTKFQTKRASKQGFTLVEVIISLAVTGVALLSILSLLSVALNQQAVNLRKTAAINLLSAITSDIKVNSSSSNLASPVYGIQTGTNQIIYADINGTSLGSSIQPSAIFCIKVNFNGPVKNSTTGTVSIYWPAQASSYQSSITSFFALN